MIFKIGDTVTLIGQSKTRFRIYAIINNIIQVECTLTCGNYLGGVYYNFYSTYLQLIEELSIKQRIILKIGQLERRHKLFLKKKYPNEYKKWTTIDYA